MNILALDLSKNRTGLAMALDTDIELAFDGPGWETLADWGLTRTSNKWAVFPSGNGIDSVVFGSWVLGSELTPRGQVFDKLQRNLAALHEILPFDLVYVEEPLSPEQVRGHTTIDTLRITLGLASTLENFCHVYRSTASFPGGIRRFQEIPVNGWRSPFIGRQKRGTKRPTLKALTMERAQQLGFKPRYDDESDAIGLLTYAMLQEDWQPRWLTNETLRPLMAAGGGR